MRGIIVMAMFAVSLAHGASHEYTEVRDLSVDAQGLSEFVIDAGAGSMSVTGVEGADGIAVTATIRIESRNDDKAREIIEERVRLTLERKGDTAKLRSELNGDWSWGANGAIDLDVRMPAGLALTVDDGSGSIVITDVRADINVDDGSGSLEISNAGAVSVDDGSGSVKIRAASGDVYVNDGSGTIDISGVAGSVTVDDGSGSITVDDVESDFIVEGDGSGSVTYTNVRGTVELDD